MEERSTADAVVDWRSDADVHIEVRSADRQHRVTRELSFRRADNAEERWRSVGLVVGTLAGSQQPVDASPMPDPTQTFARVWAGMGGAVGTGLETGRARYGGRFWVGFRPAVPPLFLHVGGEYSAARAPALDLRGTWTSFGLGIGAVLAPTRWLEIRPRIAFGVERVGAELVGSSAPNSEGNRRREIAEGGLSIAVDLLPSAALVIGATGAARHGATAVAMGPDRVTAFPAYSASALLGLELRYPPVENQ